MSDIFLIVKIKKVFDEVFQPFWEGKEATIKDIKYEYCKFLIKNSLKTYHSSNSINDICQTKDRYGNVWCIKIVNSKDK